MKKIFILLLAFLAIGVAFGTQSASAAPQNGPGNGHPWCLAEAQADRSTEGPVERCYESYAYWNYKISTWNSRLSTDFSGRDYTGRRLAWVTNSPHATTCESWSYLFPLQVSHMPKGWNDVVHSSRIDNHNCASHVLYNWANRNPNGGTKECGQQGVREHGRYVCADIARGENGDGPSSQIWHSNRNM